MKGLIRFLLIILVILIISYLFSLYYVSTVENYRGGYRRGGYGRRPGRYPMRRHYWGYPYGYGGLGLGLGSAYLYNDYYPYYNEPKVIIIKENKQDEELPWYYKYLGY